MILKVSTLFEAEPNIWNDFKKIFSILRIHSDGVFNFDICLRFQTADPAR